MFREVVDAEATVASKPLRSSTTRRLLPLPNFILCRRLRLLFRYIIKGSGFDTLLFCFCVWSPRESYSSPLLQGKNTKKICPFFFLYWVNTKNLFFHAFDRWYGAWICGFRLVVLLLFCWFVLVFRFLNLLPDRWKYIAREFRLFRENWRITPSNSFPMWIMTGVERSKDKEKELALTRNSLLCLLL